MTPDAKKRSGLDRPDDAGARDTVFHRGPRNDRRVDFWSLTHLAWGVVLGALLDPWLAFTILVLWEPFEIFVLSPILARFRIRFGHESIRNSMSDIVFDGIGVALGHWLVAPVV